MIVACPNCQSKYNLPEDKIAPTGSKVRCAKCQHVFTVKPPAPPAPPPPPADDFDAELAGLGAAQAPAAPAAAPKPAPEAPAAPQKMPWDDDEPAAAPSAGPAAAPAKKMPWDDDDAAAGPAGDEDDFPAPGSAAAKGGAFDDEDSSGLMRGGSDMLGGSGGGAGLGGGKDDDFLGAAGVGGGDSFSLDSGAAKPKDDKAAKKKKIIILASAVVGVLLVAAALFFFKPWTKFSIPFIGGAKSEKAADNAEKVKDIALRNVRQYYIPNEKAGQIFVVEGKAVNNFATPKERIKIEVSLFDEKGHVLVSKQLLCGNTLSQFQLQVQGEEEINSSLTSEVGILTSNTYLKTGMDTPFMAVFFKPPDQVKEFGVKVIDALDPK